MQDNSFKTKPDTGPKQQGWSPQRLVTLNLAIAEVMKQGDLSIERQAFLEEIKESRRFLKTEASDFKEASQHKDDIRIQKSLGLWLWLEQYSFKKKAQKTLFRFKNLLFSSGLIPVIGFLVGLFWFKLLVDKQNFVHVPLFLFSYILIPSLFLLLTLITAFIPVFSHLASTLPNKTPHKNLTKNSMPRLLKPLLTFVLPQGALPQRALSLGSLPQGQAVFLDAETQNVLGQTLLKNLQLGAVFLYLGGLTEFFYTTAFYDIHFYWESSWGGFFNKIWARLIDFLAMPWRAWLPEAAPTYEWIENSRRVLGEFPTGTEFSADPALIPQSVWIQFIGLTLLVWGIVPRFCLWLWFSFRQKYLLKNFSFTGSSYQQFWNQLNFIESKVVTAGQQDLAALFVEVGHVELEHVELGHEPSVPKTEAETEAGTNDPIAIQHFRKFLLNKLRVRPLENKIFNLDKLSSSDLAKIATEPLTQLVILCEAWDLAPRRVQNLNKKLQATFGESIKITWLIYQIEDENIQAPSSEALFQWQKEQLAWNNPNIRVVGYDS